LLRLGRGWSVGRRLPAALGGGSYPVSLEGGLGHLRPVAKVDPDLVTFATRFVSPGAVIWDIGANVGLFTFMASGLAGPSGSVLSVEPDVWLASNLLRARRWNRAGAHVDVVPVAVSDTNGFRTLNIATTRAANYLTGLPGPAVADRIREQQAVPSTTLDELLRHFPVPSVVKIDVESAEVEVLRGGSGILGLDRLAMLLEVFPHNQGAVHALLSQAGFRYLDARTMRPIESPEWSTIALKGDW
jgi:FkbM family methyltransferase